MDLHTLASLGRAKDILGILIRHGFNDLVERLGLAGVVGEESPDPQSANRSRWVRVRLALEDLGPTFVKFGQVMSLRPDLLPPDLTVELAKLQDQVAPEPFATVAEVLETSLGRPPAEVFASLDEIPLAAASLSQVHRAVLKPGGEVVAVKVRRLGIVAKVKKDLDILASLAGLLHERIEELRFYDIPGLVRVTARTLLRELDFAREARHLRIAHSHLDPNGGIRLPRVYEALSGERVLVMELMAGLKLAQLDGSPEFRQALARRGVGGSIKQILEDGFFHADPHPGNLLFTRAGEICLLDWGMVGRLSERDRLDLVEVVQAVVERDGERLMDALLGLAGQTDFLARRDLENDLLDVVDAHYAQELSRLRMGPLLSEFTALMRSYQLHLPANFAVMVKALITAEGTARQLYPELDLIAEAEPLVRKLVAGRLHPAQLWRRLRRGVGQLLLLKNELPRRLGGIIDKMDRGELTIRFEHENLESLEHTLKTTFNRLTVGIVLAALLIGSSLVITTDSGPRLFGYPALGMIGYLIAGGLGLALFLNLFRSGR